MKKYTKPSIETIEANLSADCLDEGVSGVYSTVGDGSQLAPRRKGSYDDYYEDEEDENSEFGW